MSRGNARDLDTAMLVLAAASAVISAIQDGMAERGYTDVRPAHGFAFARIAVGGATAADLAEHLGVTKQAAGQLVDQLVSGGYVRRDPDPLDARRRLLRLTARGMACTRAAEESAAAAVAAWRPSVGAKDLRALHDALARLGLGGPLRPVW